MEKTELIHELMQSSTEELQNTLEETRRNLFGLRLNAIAANQVKDYSQHKKLRKQIARILTILHSRLRGNNINK